jgi:hypothetical protein
MIIMPSGLLGRGLLPLHNSSRHHAAHATQETIQELMWDPPDYLLYTVDHTPCDVALFSPLKDHLGGKCFSCDAEAEREVWVWLRQQLTLFCTADLQKQVVSVMMFWGIAWNNKLYMLW